ncbi:hypothetical protein NDU88_007338 [Pleurodeles waltl]|uniref:Uncharacterized protein n=1 Tax=Pleurodeles waltl TaxID=8319 RepID=A0AAV7UNI9_PLEWA|nr:hypothetical protein NDU88_007338 [Pleurodeles waltl]
MRACDGPTLPAPPYPGAPPLRRSPTRNWVGLPGDGWQKQALRAVTREGGREGGESRSDNSEREGGSIVEVVEDQRTERKAGEASAEVVAVESGEDTETQLHRETQRRTRSQFTRIPATPWEERGLSRCVGQDLIKIKGKEGGKREGE